MTNVSVAFPNELFHIKLEYLEIDEVMEGDSCQSNVRHDCCSDGHDWQCYSDLVDGSECWGEIAQWFVNWNAVFGDFRQEDLIAGNCDFGVLNEIGQLVGDDGSTLSDKITANRSKCCTKTGIFFTFYGCSRNLWRIQTCGVIIALGLVITSVCWGCFWFRWRWSLCEHGPRRSISQQMIMTWRLMKRRLRSFFLYSCLNCL